LGKSFEYPPAKELAANGVNYHRFSYEIGNPDLSPEISYQIDAGVELNLRKFAIGITAFPELFYKLHLSEPRVRIMTGYTATEIKSFTIRKVKCCVTAEKSITLPIDKKHPIRHFGRIRISEQRSGEKTGFTLPFSPPGFGYPEY
jgi:iron complex outermembrane receptor protein